MNTLEYLEGLRHRLADAYEGWDTALVPVPPTPAELHAAQAVERAAQQLAIALAAALVRTDAAA